jgi:hypothetical protein
LGSVAGLARANYFIAGETLTHADAVKVGLQQR